jgi:hypothetical protein
VATAVAVGATRETRQVDKNVAIADHVDRDPAAAAAATATAECEQTWCSEIREADGGLSPRRVFGFSAAGMCVEKFFRDW